jgi:hypothetical protein
VKNIKKVLIYENNYMKFVKRDTPEGIYDKVLELTGDKEKAEQARVEAVINKKFQQMEKDFGASFGAP